ncbi:MAG: Peptidase M15 [Syntrophorhabdus sp. PtaU1.Bin153]|nr:MAG: Peptidase M15 [Syntrophorhabdus sp. PtaU1.Bin153]
MISRRCFLKCAIAFACSYRLGKITGRECAFASTGLERTTEKVLRLHNVHTGEQLHTRYCVDGDYDQNEIQRINYLLRCHYTNTVKPISIKVIDLLCAIKDRFARGKEIRIVSGYRSAEYNEGLRRLGRHVVAGSLHLTGLAIDFALPGVRTEELSKAAIQFQAGGVGLYPDFVHIDVGRVRHW